MIELSQQNVVEYLVSAGRITPPPAGAGIEKQPLVQALSGGVANIVLKVLDPNAGPPIGTDMRSPAQIKRNVPDTRMHQGACLVLKQPLPKFKTAAEWLVDIDRVNIEHDCLVLLGQILPAGSVPEVLWLDNANYIMAISAAPTGSVIWKKHLLAGRISSYAANHAGMLLAMLHSATKDDAALQQRYGNDRLFIQQRTDAYLVTLFAKHPDLTPVIEKIISELLTAKRCLIHGDFSPKNIFLVPHPGEDLDAPTPRAAAPAAGGRKDPDAARHSALSHLMLIDLEVSYYSHPAFDVATLINHLLLKAFHLGKPWRAAMIAIDSFWQTYRHTADLELAALVEKSVAPMLGALLLARVDGKSPAEYLVGNQPATERVRATGRAILQLPNATLEGALEIAAQTLEQSHS